MRWLLLLVITSCQTTNNLTPECTGVYRSDVYNDEIQQLIHRDAINKKWARMYLHEIDMAVYNNDIHAYVFYVEEFEKIPSELVPEEFRTEPGYVTPIGDLELQYRLRWWEQAILLYKQQSTH